TAQWALLLKTTLSAGMGSFLDWQSWTLAELDLILKALPSHQVELLAALVALQAEGELWKQAVYLIEGSD
ncbi:hypothetical protein ACKC4W_23860, partial [Aeromonas veronii]